MVNTDKFLANVQEAMQKLESGIEDTVPCMQEIKAPKTNMVRTQNTEQREYISTQKQHIEVNQELYCF